MRVSLARRRLAFAALAASFLSLLSEALPIVRRQDPSTVPSTALDAPSSPLPPPSLQDPPKAKFIQLPLVEVISPNVTLFAAIDMPEEGDGRGSNSVSTSTNSNNTIDGDLTPLILPTSSLALTSSQILHFDGSLMFGFGGKEPLQGVLIEWELGCNISRIFPFNNPSDQPWIALVSTASLTPPRSSTSSSAIPATPTTPGAGQDKGTIQPAKAEIGSDSPNNVVPTKPSFDHNGTYCTVSRLSRILQRASTNVAGMIIYDDPVQAGRLAQGDPNAKGIPFTQVRMQTDHALEDMVGLWDQAIHRHQNKQRPDDPPDSPPIEDDDESDKVRGGGAGSDVSSTLSPPAISSSSLAAPDAMPTRPVYYRKRQALDDESELSAKAPGSEEGVAVEGGGPTLSMDPGQAPSIRVFGVIAIADPGLINILRQSAAIGDGMDGSDQEGEPGPANAGNSSMTGLLNSRNLVVAQLTFANPVQVPIGPLVPPRLPNGQDPAPDAERPAADKSLGLFFWVILGAVVLVIGVWVGFGVAEARSMNRRRQEARANQVKLKTLNQEELEKFTTIVFTESDMAYADDEDEDDNDEKRGAGGAVTTSNGTGLSSADQDANTDQPNETLNEKQGLHSPSQENVIQDRSMVTRASEPLLEASVAVSQQEKPGPHWEQQQLKKQPVYSRFWAKPATAVAGAAGLVRNLSGVARVERAVAPGVAPVSHVCLSQEADDQDLVRRRSNSLDGSHYSSKGGHQQYWPHHQLHHFQHHYRETSHDMSEWSSSGADPEDHSQELSTSVYAGPYPRGHPFSISGFFFDRSEKCQSWDERKRELVQYDAASCLSSSSSSASIASSQQSGHHVRHPSKGYDYRSHAQEGWINLGPDTLRVFNGIEPVPITSGNHSAEEHQRGGDNDGHHRSTTADRDVSRLDIRRSSLPLDSLMHTSSSASPSFPTIPSMLYTRPTLRRKYRFILPRKIDTSPSMGDDQRQGRPGSDGDQYDCLTTAVPLHSATPPSSAGFMSLSSTLYPLGDQWASKSGFGRRRSSLGSVAAAAIMESYLNGRRRSSQATAVASNEGNFGASHGGPSLPPSALRTGFFDDASSSSSSSRSSLKDHGEPQHPHLDHPHHHLQHRHSTPVRRSYELWRTAIPQDSDQTLRRGSVQVHRVLPPSMPSPVVSAHMPSVAHVLYQHHSLQAQESTDPLEQEKKEAQSTVSDSLPSQSTTSAEKKLHNLDEPWVGTQGQGPHHKVMPSLPPPPLTVLHARDSSESVMVHLADLRKQDSQETAIGDGKVAMHKGTLPLQRSMSSSTFPVKRISLDKAAMQARRDIEQFHSKASPDDSHEMDQQQQPHVAAATAEVRPHPALRRSSGQQVYRIPTPDEQNSKTSLDKDITPSTAPSTPRAVLTSADKGKAPIDRTNDDNSQREELLLHTSSTVEEEVESAKQRLSQMGIELPGVYVPTSGEFSRLSIDSGLFHLGSDTSSSDVHAGAGVGEASASAGKRPGTSDPTVKIENSTNNNNNNNSNSATQPKSNKKRKYDPCAICFDDYAVGDVIRELPCRHAFHAVCIDPYFLRVKAVCPICQADYSEAGRRRTADRAAGNTSNNDSSSSDSTGEERSRRTILTYFTPLALLAGANGGAHYWYASETLAHMSGY
ncbi:E3 ubiquitin-protein ligase rnf13 [Actinomortierella ambigua]|uniref:E3 ubiquitin-protein ligase rnf13 n=1 Tax=Actinomortierella ambigua TaxID=1343610 RepID=A0A9P6Q2P6_9FUNG|nr:E3 ubiquitin-protein ligase rnf13 [Actinomortierella ambigua]